MQRKRKFTMKLQNPSSQMYLQDITAQFLLMGKHRQVRYCHIVVFEEDYKLK